MQNPMVPGPDQFTNWLDRLGNMMFISDEMGQESLHPEYYWAMVRDSDKSGVESAVWHM